VATSWIVNSIGINLIMNNLIFGRVIVLFFAGIFGVVWFVYCKIITIYNEKSIKRVLYGAPCVAGAIGLIFIQLNIFSSITHIRKPIDGDVYFVCIVLSEAVLAIAALFMVLLKNRSSIL